MWRSATKKVLNEIFDVDVNGVKHSESNRKDASRSSIYVKSFINNEPGVGRNFAYSTVYY